MEMLERSNYAFRKDVVSKRRCFRKDVLCTQFTKRGLTSKVKLCF